MVARKGVSFIAHDKQRNEEKQLNLHSMIISNYQKTFGKSSLKLRNPKDFFL